MAINDKKLIEDYFNYNQDEDPTGSRGHFLASQIEQVYGGISNVPSLVMARRNSLDNSFFDVSYDLQDPEVRQGLMQENNYRMEITGQNKSNSEHAVSEKYRKFTERHPISDKAEYHANNILNRLNNKIAKNGF